MRGSQHGSISHIFHNWIHHEREILLYHAHSYSSQCQWTCDAYVGLGVCVRVYILSPILSFNVQITYECYEVLKSKSLDNTCNVRQMIGIYFRKGFGKPVTKRIRFWIFHDAIRNGTKKLPVWWRLTKDRLLMGKRPIPTNFHRHVEWKIVATGMKKKELNSHSVCTNLNSIAMEIGVRWTLAKNMNEMGKKQFPM